MNDALEGERLEAGPVMAITSQGKRDRYDVRSKT